MGIGDRPHEPIEAGFPVGMQEIVRNVIQLAHSREGDEHTEITEAGVIDGLRGVPDQLSAGNTAEVVIMRGETVDGVAPNKFGRLTDLDPTDFFDFEGYIESPVENLKRHDFTELEVPKTSRERDWSEVFQSLNERPMVRLTGLEQDGLELLFSLREHGTDVSSAVFLAVKYQRPKEGHGEYDVTASVIFHTEPEPQE